MKTHKWADLRRQMSPEAQRDVQERVERTARHLDEIRRARGMTQLMAARSRSSTRCIDVSSTSSAYSESVLKRLISSGSSSDDTDRSPRCVFNVLI